MAKLRSINTGIWDDEWFCDLSDREQKLFLYFLTNRLTTMAGAYKIPQRVIRHDTGLSEAGLTSVLAKFKRDGKAEYREGWIVLTNFLKNQSLNDNMRKGVLSEIADAPGWVAKKVLESIKTSRTLSKAFEPFQTLISEIETLSTTPVTLRKDEVEDEREVEDEKEIEPRPPDKSDWPEIVFKEWQKVLKHPKTSLDKKREDRIKARIKDGFSLEELLAVPRGVLKSPYHLGQNETNTRYDGINTIYRDREQVEKFRDLAESNGTHTQCDTARKTDTQDGKYSIGFTEVQIMQ